MESLNASIQTEAYAGEETPLLRKAIAESFSTLSELRDCREARRCCISSCACRPCLAPGAPRGIGATVWPAFSCSPSSSIPH